MSFGSGGFGGFGQQNNQQQSTGFGGFGQSNTPAGKFAFPSICCPANALVMATVRSFPA